MSELSDKLKTIYLGGQTLNHTAMNIIRFIEKGDIEQAKREYSWDGDKIPSYNRWGKEFLEALYQSEIGCRTHNITKCDRWLCNNL